MLDAFRFTQTEDTLLNIAARYVRVTAEQFARHHETPSTLGFVRKKLMRLVEVGYLTASTGFSQNGKPPYVFSPSMRGWRYAEEHHGLPIPTRWRPSEARITDFRDYLHDLAITDLGLAVERFCHEGAPDVRLARFLHDRFLPQTPVLLPNRSTRAGRLDAFIELHLKRGTPLRTKQRCFLAEIDRDTHYRKALTDKLLHQVAYVRGGHYQADFGTMSLTYLWLCPGGAERVAKLLKLTEAVLKEHDATEYAPLFLFTSANPASVDPVTLFIGDCWSAPFQRAPVSLLGYAPRATVNQQSHFMPQEAFERFMTTAGAAMPHVAAEQELGSAGA